MLRWRRTERKEITLQPAQERAAAGLIAATVLASAENPPTASELTAFADRIVPWINRGPIIVTIDYWTYEQGSSKRVQTTYNGGKSMASMTDTQQFVASIEVEDAKNFETTDPNALSWTVDDGSVASAQPSDDGLSCTFVAGNPGTTAYRVSDGTITSADGAITVTAGDAAQIAVSESAPTEQGA